MRKTYVCEMWPHLQLGWIQFRDGTYTTDDEATQQMIEHSDSYGVHIHLDESRTELEGESQAGIEEEAYGPPEPEPEPPRRGPGRPPTSSARQGQTGTRDLR